jgi:CRP-like cAMP-binding protein
MIEKFKNNNPELWKKYHHLFKEIMVPDKTILLHEGEISQNIYFIKIGCLRAWFNKDGKDITTQFFFEKQGVASIESFHNRVPSIINIETIEPSELSTLSKNGLDLLFNDIPRIKDGFYELILQRFIDYSKLFISRIKDSPRERYLDLVKNNPDIIKRVPQHYIASYLGITPVSLSRIKNRK